MISIIVPTYNVKKYIDRCLDSIINQTYSDFEVIIIDGNSTDGTIEREDSWVKKDIRIKRYFQKSKGLGPARDEGVEYARGEYVTFIDSDDWWNLTYLEKMSNAILESNADICMCDRINYHFSSDGRVTNKYPMTKPIMQDGSECYDENPEILQMLEVSINGKLFRKKLFTENRIKTPWCAAEDRAVMHYVLYKARGIARVREPLYYYHAERGGSLVNTIKAWSTMDVCLNTLHDYFKRENDDSLHQILRMISVDTALAGVDSMRNVANGNIDAEADELIKKIKSYHTNRYPDIFEKQYIIGSYSLRREVWLAYHSFDEIRVHQQYSSVVSLMSSPLKAPGVELKDNNRKRWFENDFQKGFLTEIKPKTGEYIFIDFLEERFDIGKKGDSYFTWSDLYEDTVTSECDVKRISRLSDEADVLFREACDRLIEKLLIVTDATRIVLVRNRLCNRMGFYKGTAIFFNHEWIEQINKKLDRYYDYFIEKCPGVVVITPNENESFFSYEGFPFGCAPYHVNDAFYHNVAYEIRRKIIS
ncbi:Glycosyltransferase involved in cell wall bisynthesis [Pseudobutyrivibrio sp. YE44]|uniref:glycosyltransferase n=1 Tax=Pseudobutyrivibrio sp. YE44 TaxID=1520802 RepID=UPI00088B1466|nr:glycosyltransferase [Pseudobutyrivibrio sp. YE44]SDB28955.1 Glycosyltransferase involved in cell wall bisynthesis [Pseudobutyrivibrio sp. YE44]